MHYYSRPATAPLQFISQLFNDLKCLEIPFRNGIQFSTIFMYESSKNIIYADLS